MIAFTIILVTLIICVTVIIGIFLSNQDNYSYLRVESDLREINDKLDKLIKKSN